MTDDLRDRIRRTLAEAESFDYDTLEPHDYQQHADAILALVQPIADELAENEGVIKALRRQRDQAEAERDRLASVVATTRAVAEVIEANGITWAADSVRCAINGTLG